ncbi:MAG TPA: methylmalonyl-CoA mutase family protein [Calditrichia bacterium]|nr:hypothetical protein [Calditrichota bacterium]HQU72987.1 methylmalonyl-CoA mutase family protein [Calditrichia bacterium]HQV31994.1 methylmalonyl-CoA mutase family protein [Calditrichia bacterium]
MANSTDRLTGTLDFNSEFPAPDREAWQAAATALLKGAPFDKVLRTSTPEDITLEPIYTREDLQEIPFLNAPPGTAPFVRGRGVAGWQMAQTLFEREPGKFNEALHQALQGGQNAVRLDLENGFPRIEGAADFGKALHNVDLTLVPIFLSGVGPKTIGYFKAFCDEAGLDSTRISGSLGLDFLGNALKWGGFPKDFATRTGACLQAALRDFPAMSWIDINAQHITNAGGSVTQELGVFLAIAAEYARNLSDGAVEHPRWTAAVRLRSAIGPDMFREIAGLRAARLLWTRFQEVLHPGSDPVCLEIDAVSGTWQRSFLDRHVNLLRGTCEAFAAVVGGADSIDVLPFEGEGQSGATLAVRLARNTQLILAEEAHLAKVADPAGGSYYLEKLTQALAEKAWAYFREIEGEGGYLVALKSGKIYEDVSRIAGAKLAALGSRKKKIIGVNVYANPAEDFQPLPPMYDGTESRGEDNGPLVAVAPLDFTRGPAPYEMLREKVAVLRKERPSAAGFLLLPIGQPAQIRPRADFARGFCEVGGFDVLDPGTFPDPQAALDAVAKHRPAVVVLCAEDDHYPAWIPLLGDALKGEAHPPFLVVAGAPGEQETSYRRAGVSFFVHRKSNILETLTALLKQLEVRT